MQGEAGFSGNQSQQSWEIQRAQAEGQPAGRASARTALRASSLRPGVLRWTALVKPVWPLEPDAKPLIWFRAGSYWLAP